MILGYCTVAFIFVIIAVLRAKKGKSAKGILIAGFVVGVLAAIGAFGQASAGGSFEMTDILQIIAYFVVMIVGVFVVKSKSASSME